MIIRRVRKACVLLDSRLYWKYIQHMVDCELYYRDCRECCIFICDVKAFFVYTICNIIGIFVIRQLNILIDYYNCEKENSTREMCDTFEKFMSVLLVTVLMIMTTLQTVISIKLFPLIIISRIKCIKWRNHVTKEFQLFMLSKRLDKLNNDLLDRHAVQTTIGRFL